MLSLGHAIAFLEAISSHYRSKESGLVIPFTRKPCVFFEPPTNAKVEVVIEDGVGAESASMDIAEVMVKRPVVLYGLQRMFQNSEPEGCLMLVVYEFDKVKLECPQNSHLRLNLGKAGELKLKNIFSPSQDPYLLIDRKSVV